MGKPDKKYHTKMPRDNISGFKGSPSKQEPSSYLLSTPRPKNLRVLNRFKSNPDTFGRATESFARFMGTPQFLIWMTIICGSWLAWNWFTPEELQFDPRELNFTLLTLILSLQASYAAPLLLLAQNRQDDRDRVIYAQDRLRGERNLANTEYLNREMASLRISLREMATRDYVRAEIKSLLEELQELQQERDGKLAALIRDGSKLHPKENPANVKGSVLKDPQPGSK